MKELLEFLQAVIKSRLDHECGKTQALEKPQLELFIDTRQYLGKVIDELGIKDQDLLLLALALVPYIDPGFLSRTIQSYFPDGTDFPEIGGYKGKYHRGMLPTGETLLFLLAGRDPSTRKKYLSIFEDSLLFRNKYLFLGDTAVGEPFYAGPLLLDTEFSDRLLLEKVRTPKPSSDFPAELIQTELDWEDLVLSDRTLAQIKGLEHWLSYNEQLMERWNLKKKVKPGYRVMFFGPPGTGKTLTAGLLGKYTDREVYRIDLSLMVSKYIGETEKNLSRLFDKASGKHWILFFDEADALFGKRTNVRDAHDKYANQEVSYLLQRIEQHPGMVILASNFKSNLDSAFTRRFQSIIDFEAPGAKERLLLWEKNLPESMELENGLHVPDLAKKYPLTGANIVNIVQQVGLKTLAAGHACIKEAVLMQCIRNEIQKEGKIS
ncbi:ATPase family associated with various cellular activities (AAA) [Cyclobacterium xiamenense]|uniref:ATPase family associated with various cellular activities (AAA) n=1 Tax=Cyclobacterium xiamenense TaxID=1297121 RepID=A0A1H6UAB9_9BACT|nr:ATP-binding protein [Cyclobacterium xiamenense]SEI85175.1 ATPase family associated with various cellular activities (AAA) [Cyclobacterium xiamenense]